MASSSYPILTERAKRVLAIAHELAIREGESYIGTDHLLAALLSEEEGPHRAFVNMAKARAAARQGELPPHA